VTVYNAWEYDQLRRVSHRATWLSTQPRAVSDTRAEVLGRIGQSRCAADNGIDPLLLVLDERVGVIEHAPDRAFVGTASVARICTYARAGPLACL
jgi:hypothetical protein